MSGLLLSPQEDSDTKASQAISTLQPLPWEYLVAWGKPGRQHRMLHWCLPFCPIPGLFWAQTCECPRSVFPSSEKVSFAISRRFSYMASLLSCRSCHPAQFAPCSSCRGKVPHQLQRTTETWVHLWSQGHSKVILPAAW